VGKPPMLALRTKPTSEQIEQIGVVSPKFREGDTNDTDVTAGWPFG
jgi:hypothetical protein